MAVAAELGLTHRELEIVPLLVAGRTNAEIAQALVISPRTVGVHVSRILMKLGATRRTEAADIARAVASSAADAPAARNTQDTSFDRCLVAGGSLAE